eukprot:scaffold5831_cov77-Cylindrotheca_fusiformis.AAC.3
MPFTIDPIELEVGDIDVIDDMDLGEQSVPSELFDSASRSPMCLLKYAVQLLRAMLYKLEAAHTPP